jgi:selenocysteine-specific elongation factor
MIVATAGHIDHGKTSLIRALTGVETDRLPEERARGISIDLGFAYWRPDDGPTIAFVDVPGHERFIRNMLAGMPGVDLGLLVIAANDGLMPQTLEHLQILELLAVPRLLVAITKCDLVGAERVAQVRTQIAKLLEPTWLAGTPVFEVSTPQGLGIAELGAALRAQGERVTEGHVAGRNFRMAVDRSFSVTGVGTVAAGTVVAGRVRVGDRLVISPRGTAVRVRGLQSGGADLSEVVAGQRCAINLAGVELAQVRRGAWLVAPAMHAPTTRIEARLTVLESLAGPLKHNTPVHLHLGTADISARVLIPKQAPLPPGSEAVVHLALEQATSAVHGDRFVLRDQSGRSLIGGGSVIDPEPPLDRRRQGGRAAVTDALEHRDPARALAALLEIPGHEVEATAFERCFNLEPEAAQALYLRAGVNFLGGNQGLILSASRIERVVAQVTEALEAFHREHPGLPGVKPGELRAMIAEPITGRALAAVLKDMSERRLVDLGGAFVKLHGHSASFSDAEIALWRGLVGWLENRDPRPFTVEDAVQELRTREAALKSLLYKRSVNGDLFRVDERRYILRTQVADLARIADELAAANPEGFTAAQFRDASGIGRNSVIHVLEFFDRVGITGRRGNLRRMRPDFNAVTGERTAKPARP